MGLQLSREQQMLKDMVRNFAETEVGYIINGHKVFTTMVSVADYICLAAATAR